MLISVSDYVAAFNAIVCFYFFAAHVTLMGVANSPERQKQAVLILNRRWFVLLKNNKRRTVLAGPFRTAVLIGAPAPECRNDELRCKGA